MGRERQLRAAGAARARPARARTCTGSLGGMRSSARRLLVPRSRRRVRAASRGVAGAGRRGAGRTLRRQQRHSQQSGKQVEGAPWLSGTRCEATRDMANAVAERAVALKHSLYVVVVLAGPGALYVYMGVAAPAPCACSRLCCAHVAPRYTTARACVSGGSGERGSSKHAAWSSVPGCQCPVGANV